MDTDKIRQDFPIFKNDIIYLDSACMSLRPVQVIEAMDSYYYEFPACAGRSLHKLSKRVTEEVSESRKAVKNFINAKKEEEIIFTKNTTESINLIAKSFKFEKNDKIITSDKEHNSNLVPWLINKNINHLSIDSKKNHTFNLELFKENVKKAKLVAINYVSNLDGYIFPVKEIIKIAHENGALVLLDAAQAAPHREINVKKLEVDFLAFSGHKMLGPSGVGILYGKYELLNNLNPFLVGGDTVKETWQDKFILEDLPSRFEAGLQNYPGIIGLKAAIDYIKRIGLNEIENYEEKLTRSLIDGLNNIPGVNLIGYKGTESRSGVVSFALKKMNHHDIALLLNETNSIMIRSGAHCVHSWFNKNNLEGSARASIYFYNTKEDIMNFTEAVSNLTKLS